jgi:hypothetical protein
MVFCDWLSCYQEHFKRGENTLPVLNNGCVAQFEADAIKQFIDPETGELKTIFDTAQIEWTTQKHFDYEGSYSTKIRIKCDGSRVTFDGNVSRFGRRDNVFGFGVIDCIVKANEILALLGLPPFTNQKSAPTKGDGLIPTGCIITRVDLTKNYAAGSLRNAVRLIHYFGCQDAGRRASAKLYGENGVSWNEGSKFWYAKLYLKADSLGEHAHPKLEDWVRDNGILRHEISLKSRYLTQHGLRNIMAWRNFNKTNEEYYSFEGESMENIVYGRFTDVLTRGTATTSALEDIPKNIGRIARDWRQGIDVWGDTNYGESTRRRWRKQLLAYGIDIKKPSNITALPIRLEVINLQPAAAPDWYWNQDKQVRAA